MRRIVVFVSSIALLAPLSLASARSLDPPVVPDHLRAYSIIPPGQSGSDPAHQADQLSMYADLIDDDGVSDADLDVLFHDFQFGPATTEREYSPRADVTVYRDGFGIPHVYGGTDNGAAFGLGYVTAEDRLWHMDVLRHAALGRVSEILGEGAFSFDKGIRRDTYTLSELREMSDYVVRRYGETGTKLVKLLRAYANGVNAFMDEVRAGTKPKPLEYSIQDVELEDWRPIDTIALAVFQLRQFGESAGAELRNAALYQNLRQRLGRSLGTQVFRDLTSLNDANAYATIPGSEGTFESQDIGEPKRQAIVVPDDAEQEWDQVSSPARSPIARALVPSTPASHFLAVAPGESETGHSLQWGGPQVGYSVPQFFMEIDVHSPNLDFRGPALPGASVLVPLGRGIDYAWSLTSGISDAVDTRVEKLCGRHSYRFDGRCRRMQMRKEVIKFGSAPNADRRTIKVSRTVHGPVIGRGTVGGDPVAFVRQRRFWKHEIDTLPAIYNMISNSMDTVDEFRSQVAKWTVSFNVSYVDANDIAYFHVGKYPERRQGVDPMLPTWGTKRWDWTGTISFSDHPQLVNPAQGWVANWNNKPSTGWDNGDGTQWGPTHRVRLLSDKMEELVAGAEQASLAEIVDVIREAATQDARAEYIGRDMIAFVSGATGTEAEARDAVAAWIVEGSHRLDQDGDGNQDFGPAVAVYDRWYEELVHRVFDDELGNDYNLVPVPISDDASRNNGSSYFADFSNYLWNLFEGADDYARDYCDDLGTEGVAETCDEQAEAALSAAVAELSAAQGPTVANWTHPADYIEFDAVGGLSMPPIPWQNRGTYNHAVEVTGSRP